MKFEDYCKEQKLSQSEVKAIAEKRDAKVLDAYKRYARPAYYRTCAAPAITEINVEV